MDPDKLVVVIQGVLASLNDYNKLLSHNRYKGGDYEAGWKDKIEWEVWHYLDQEVLDTFPLSWPLKCTVRVWRPNAMRRDIHNLFLKPVFDAFSNVGIWPDDSEAYCPVVEYVYMGIDRKNPRVEFTFERIKKWLI